MIEEDLQTIIEAKHSLLNRRRKKTPMPAITALADMQKRPHPILNEVTDQGTLLIGHIRLQETYDPVAAALRFVRTGLDAVALFTDNTIYSKGMEDLLMVARGVPDTPVISQNYILNAYHVLEARASGASGLILYSALLDPATLREVASLSTRLKMSAILQVNSRETVELAHLLSPHAVSIGFDANFDQERDLPLLKSLRPYLPYNMRVMPHGVVTAIDDLRKLLSMGMDAIALGESLVATPQARQQLAAVVDRALTV
ncbi:MAG: hypothetical protein ACOCYT_01935 [Chloroflexota bacterium]